MENFQNFFKTFLLPAKRTKEGPPGRVENPFSEIQLLREHADIVRILIKVGEGLFASSSDDGRIVVWDYGRAERLFVLAGHTSSVTCFLLLGEVLVSGSTDKSLRFWNLKKGECILHLPNSHESSIKCLVDIGDEKFCSGGNDRFLRIWSYQGTLIGVIERQEEENLHCLLAISNKRIVTGSNSSLLHTYNTETMKFISFFTNHRESVRCLVNINEELFASASLDGVIVVWKSDLSPCRTLSYPEKFDSKFYSCSVNDLLVLQEKYLAACIGNGFQIFNIHTGDKVMDCSNTHVCAVNSIISVGGGAQFVTCSSDTQLKLWGNTKNFNFSFDAPEINDNIADRLLKRKPEYYPPICIGEMFGHTDQVSVLLKLTESSFVSGGHDNMIILWKNGEEENYNRNFDARCSLNANNFFDVATLQQRRNSQSQSNTYQNSDSSSGFYEPNNEDSEERDSSYSTEDFRYDYPNTRKSKPIYTTSLSPAHAPSHNPSTSEDDEKPPKPTNPPTFPLFRSQSDIRPPKPSLVQSAQLPKSPQTDKIPRKTSEPTHHTKGPAPAGAASPRGPESPPGRAAGQPEKVTSPPIPVVSPQKRLPKQYLSHTPLEITVAENQKTRKVRIPIYILEFAENLFIEESFSFEQIKDNLTKQGHNKSIVEAVIQLLKQSHGD